MIEKIISIQDVGVYKSCQPSDSTIFDKVTLLYGENKRGKSTLVDILRSLNKGQADIIKGRVTVNAAKRPFVNIRINSKNYLFRQGVWLEDPIRNLEIFDEKFVNKHVITGYSITSDHKKKLNSIIVSDESKKLINEIEQIKVKVKNKNIEISNSENLLIENQDGEIYRLKEFLEKYEETDFEKVSQMKTKEISELLAKVDRSLNRNKKKEQILKGQELSQVKKINLSYSEEEILNILNKQIQLSSMTVEMISKHIQRLHMNGGEEKWLREGTENIKEGVCPFCTQSLELVEKHVLELKEYFEDDDYKVKIKKITKLLVSLQKIHIEEVLHQNDLIVERNNKRKLFWRDFLELNNEPLEISNSQELEKALRELKEFVRQKKETPIGGVDESVEKAVKRTFNIVGNYNKKAEEFNNYVGEINVKIQSLKSKSREEANTKDLTKKKAFLVFIMLAKNMGRINSIKKVFKLKKQKLKLDREMVNKRKDLEEKVKEDHRKYSKQVNEELDSFKSNISIQNLENTYKGTSITPFSEYGISLNGQDISLDIDENKFSIINTLSTSDRRTLALCFFLAKLKVDSNIGNKIVIFDDPASSYDKHHEHDLCYKLNNIAKDTEQIVVFSHNFSFLLKLQELLSHEFGDKLKTLKIIRTNNNYSKIVKCDIDETDLNQYFEDFRRLERYLEDEEAESKADVARSAIVVLEKFLKIKFPNEFVSQNNLGGMIRYLKGGSISQYLKPFKIEHLRFLEEMNDYFAGKKHGDIKNQELLDSELNPKVEEIINFIYK